MQTLKKVGVILLSDRVESRAKGLNKTKNLFLKIKVQVTVEIQQVCTLSVSNNITQRETNKKTQKTRS